ncbi:Type I Iterative PKS [Diaporthe australafricana]|uniref:Type I Iterative PKS n=1 Tax=Diaporthe australafricana TaxID=127596 RepID=A0ABR3WGZ4_9PEZI
MSTATIQTLLRTSEELHEKVKSLADLLSAQSAVITEQLSKNGTGAREAAGSLHDLWEARDGHEPIEKAKANITGLAQDLGKLTLGPQGFIHELVSVNWEHGALYVALEYGVLETFPEDGSTRSLAEIAEQTGLPAQKLLPICRLLACSGIICEAEAGNFGHTFISTALAANKGFSSWVGFQLYETRLASANLADWLKQPSEYFAGPAAFDLALGMPMHKYHSIKPEKGQRFFKAMNSVAQDGKPLYLHKPTHDADGLINFHKGLDAGNEMVLDWVKSRHEMMADPKNSAVIVAGKSIGAFAERLAAAFPEVNFELRGATPDEVNPPGGYLRRLFLLYGVLWILDDENCVELLRKFVPLLSHPSRPILLVCDLVSPEKGQFDPHVELAFRRRDVTLMTMHNAQQRTAKKWAELIKTADSRFQVSYKEKHTSHSCRGIWEIQMRYGRGGEPYPSARTTCVVGPCAGGFAAAAICSSQTLTELIPAAVEAVIAAFRTAHHAYMVGRDLSSPRSSSNNKAWSAVVSPRGDEKIGDLLQEYEVTKLYISATLPNNRLTLSGPPHILDDFLQRHQSCLKYRYLDIFSPFHAAHLFDASVPEDIVSHVNNDVVANRVPDAGLLSGSTGKVANAPNFRALLRATVADVLCEPVQWNSILSAVQAFWTDHSTDQCTIIPVSSNSAPMICEQISKAGPIKVSVEDVAGDIKRSLRAPNSADTQTGRFVDSKIAVVGFSGRFPSADSNDAFWDLLRAGRDVHRDIPSDRFDWKAHYDPTGKTKNTSRIRYGCFIDDPGHFDARFFNMSPREAENTDPAQRLAITTTYEAMEMSGMVRNRTPSTQQDRIGVFFGTTSDDWREVNSGQNVDTYFIPGGNRAFVPGRISYFFRFSGPSVSMDTACSSSFAAMQTACTYLWRGECDTAIAGGTNVLTNPDNFAGLDRGHFLSTTGNCNAFDDGANGYCRADAVGSVILKRLEDAEADNDPIFGVIVGSTTNHCGQTDSITRPHEGDQSSVFKRIMRYTNYDPLDVGYIEMHPTPWRRENTTSGKRACFLNNFSAAGGNTAVLLEDAPPERLLDENPESVDRRPIHLVTCTGRSAKALQDNIKGLVSWLRNNPTSGEDLPALSYTTTARRMHHNYRTIVSGSSVDSIISTLKSRAAQLEAVPPKPVPQPAHVPNIVFTFTGQGGIYTSMGQTLFDCNPKFKESITRFDHLAHIHGFPSFVGLIDGSHHGDAQEASPAVQQLAMACLQMALTELLGSWGVKPSAVIGHSLGEYAGLHAAGVLSASDVIYLVGTRATLLERHCEQGTHAMLAVKAPMDVVNGLLSHSGCGCELACLNQPTGQVIAGPLDNISDLERRAKAMSIETVRLDVPYAFHSPQVEPILDEFLKLSSRGVIYHPPNLPVLSPLMARTISPGERGQLDGKYLTRACRNPVVFFAAVEAAMRAEVVDQKTSE